MGAVAAAIIAAGAWLALDSLRRHPPAANADPKAVRLEGPV